MTMGTYLREERLRRGWSQVELAQRVGVTRQSIIALEQDRHQPSLDLAMRIAQAFNISLDHMAQLVSEPNDEPLFFPVSEAASAWIPVVWARLHARLIVVPTHRLLRQTSPDALYHPTDGTLVACPGSRSPSQVVFVGGCDPYAGWLADQFHALSSSYFLEPIRLSSHEALQAFKDGLLHVAGTHLYDEVLGSYNPKSLMPFPTFHIPHLIWEEGLLQRPQGAIKQWAVREAGSEAHALFLRQDPSPSSPVQTFFTHESILETVARGQGWAGIGLGALGVPRGLEFHPWSMESYDFWIRQEDVSEPWFPLFMESRRSKFLKSRFANLQHIALSDS